MKVVCFYLPQYHPIPENDAWWGKGFTEWTNVARARPRFRGHYQPHIPADLGFYDLRLEETRLAQARLAAEYGIHGFCYYHYWFNGKQLLQRPFEEVLESGRPDFPFCLCWANENWTRRWDGLEREVLIAQDYAEYDPVQHMEWLARAFADPRYIRVHGRPLFLVYRADAIPSLQRVLGVWRETACRCGIPEPYLCSVRSPGSTVGYVESVQAGFDSMAEFHPTQWSWRGRGLLAKVGGRVRHFSRRAAWAMLGSGKAGASLRNRVFSYRRLVEEAIRSPPVGERVFPCVMPGWDNSARRRAGATIIQNDDAELYGKWLKAALRRVSSRRDDEQIVFINAWNEWGEGCHLEPDQRNGRRFLVATREALREVRASESVSP